MNEWNLLYVLTGMKTKLDDKVVIFVFNPQLLNFWANLINLLLSL